MVMVLLGVLGSEATQGRHASAPEAQLRLTEVYYDTPGEDGREEWVELANLGPSAVSLDDLLLGDEESRGGGEGMYRFPLETVLTPGQVIVVAQHHGGFRALFGDAPDFEFKDGSPQVPDMIPELAWATGELALNNDGDEVMLIRTNGLVIDAVVYGNSQGLSAFRPPSVVDVARGQSIARVPASCDVDSADDWLIQSVPNPGRVDLGGSCRQGATLTDDTVPIGRVQGPEDISPMVSQQVTVAGTVTGQMADRNARGVVFHSFFVQNNADQADGDPRTSDGIAVFTGATALPLTVGEQVTVTGQVTEFYGLTEIDDDGLVVHRTGEIRPMPPAEELPLDITQQQVESEWERLEGMLVHVNEAVVVGATHPACGFDVADTDIPGRPMLVLTPEATDYPLLGVLHVTDEDCSGAVTVNGGDRVEDLVGPLSYHFNRFKIVQSPTEPPRVVAAARRRPRPSPEAEVDQFSVATFNLGDYLPTSEPGEAKATVATKRRKLSYAIVEQLHCPTVLGVQEAGGREMLDSLVESVRRSCGFRYQISHLPTADGRGADLALLTEPELVEIEQFLQRQSCTMLPAEVVDEEIECPSGERPLFSRPPLEVHLRLAGQRVIVFVNHFKSKRDGVEETAPLRLAQAQHLLGLVDKALSTGAGVIVMGDLNDYDGSATIATLLATGQLMDGLASLPGEERYSYVFDGRSQLLDWILVSTGVKEWMIDAGIVRGNADYAAALSRSLARADLPFRSSDHDIPYVVLCPDCAVAEATSSSAEARRASPTPVASPVTSVAATTPTTTADSVPATLSPVLALGVVVLVLIGATGVLLFRGRDR
ncbi:MAG: lamin tail domain-containing protein [Candidatus Promineifilaceae bacterium]|nr:lamin tail domain-containing protein [Candidatus Promineifilaceae bacterium]